MKKFKRSVAALVAASFLTCSAAPSFAASDIEEIFSSSMYGGLTGALIGAAFMAFTKKPSDHLMNPVYGGAAGIILGAGYGIAKTSKSFAEIKDGNVKFAMPTIVPQVTVDNSGKSSVIYTAQLLKTSF